MDGPVDPKRPGPNDDLLLGRDMSTGRKLPQRGIQRSAISLVVFVLGIAALDRTLAVSR